MAVEIKLRKTKGETHGSDGGAIRSFSQSEKRGYIDYINQDMAGDPDLPSLPVNTETDDIFTVIGDGVLLAKMINKTFPGTIEDAKIAKKPKNVFEVNLNHDVCLEGAKAIGCSTINIGAGDLREGKQHLVMGLLWQVIKACLMYQISQSMDLQRLADADEAIDKVPPEQILLRWFNYHLKNAGHSHRAVTNFGEDIADGECYAVLFSEIAPDTVTPDELERAFRCKDPLSRAEVILEWAEKLHCRKFVSASDIAEGNPRLNLAFVATLFQRFPKLGPTPEELVKQRLNETEVKLEEAENLLADAMCERDSLQADLDKTKLDFDSLSAELGDLKLDFDSIKVEKDAAVSKVNELETLLSSISTEKASLADELSKTKAEKDDLFAQLEQELSFKLDLEDQLSKTRFELSDIISKTTDEIANLNTQLTGEIQLKNDLSATLEETMLELEQTRATANQKETELLEQLSAESSQKEALRSELDTTKAQLNETIRLQKEAEQTKDDLFKLLTDTISELEATKKTATEKEDNLETELAQERKVKEDFALKLKERNDEYDKSVADWSDERAKLLARIKELEEELETLKVDMRAKLEESERAKEAALARARELMEQALSEAENEKDAALDKMRLLLTTNQKQGYLHIYMVSGILGTKNWTKRYFVLRDNLLAWYKSDAHMEKKPLGVIYCEEARLYEMDENEVGRPLCFQISSGAQKWNVAAESLEEMRSWMTEIRVAKKRKLGVQVVGGQGRSKKDKGDKGDKSAVE